MKRFLLICGFFLGFSSGFFAIFSPSSFAAGDEDDTGDIIDQKDYDPDTPYYLLKVPGWAAGLRVSFPAVPVKTAIGPISELYFEKMLPFQKIGVFSLGLHFGVVPLNSDRFDNVKYGGLVRYQLHFMKNQIIVPTAALVYEVYRLKSASNSVNAYNSPGILLGALINLGFFDREAAREANQSISLLRSYLSIEMRPLNMSTFSYGVAHGGSYVALNGVNGAVWYWGVRLEFE